MILGIRFIPRSEYQRVRAAALPSAEKSSLPADMSRPNLAHHRLDRVSPADRTSAAL